MSTPPNYSLAAPAKRPEILALAQDLNGTPSGEEYEKMISGMMYDPTVPALLEARHLARGLAAAYNNLDTTSVPFDKIGEVRLELLRKLVGKVGDKTFVEPPFRPDYGCNISFGREVFVNFGLTVLDTSLVVIGDRVQIASNVSIIAASHDPSVLSRRRG
ncbi:trimeric LpxA-like protein, partial [Aspergillus indologenus CBS 114.80]